MTLNFNCILAYHKVTVLYGVFTLQEISYVCRIMQLNYLIKRND